MNSMPTPALDAPLRVRRCEPADDERWEAFVQRCPGATFFHRIGWRTVLQDVFHHRMHYLLAERGGSIAGVLPLAQVKSMLFGHTLVSLPFAVYGGAAADDSAVASALHDAAVELGAELGVRHLELRQRVPTRPDWPRQDLYVCFRKPLLADAEANLLAIPRKQRAMIRKGIQRGLRSEVDPGVDRFHALYADNQHRHGTPPQSKRYFQALRDVFGDDCEVLCVFDPRGREVSAVMSFYFRDEVLPYYAGDLPAARELAANDFKYWELMRRGCERGVRVFDYGRSKRDTGSYDFKKNWGFEAVPLHYEYKLYTSAAIPQNHPSNPTYKRMIKLWRRMPIGVANRLGPFLVRGLG
jgi:FemAB-related protein (PEP-CTERM system-associated)